MCVCLPNSTQNCQKGFTKGQRDGRAKTIQVVSNLKILKGSMKNKVSNVQFFHITSLDLWMINSDHMVLRNFEKSGHSDRSGEG